MVPASVGKVDPRPSIRVRVARVAWRAASQSCDSMPRPRSGSTSSSRTVFGVPSTPLRAPLSDATGASRGGRRPPCDAGDRRRWPTLDRLRCLLRHAGRSRGRQSSSWSAPRAAGRRRASAISHGAVLGLRDGLRDGWQTGGIPFAVQLDRSRGAVALTTIFRCSGSVSEPGSRFAATVRLHTLASSRGRRPSAPTRTVRPPSCAVIGAAGHRPPDRDLDSSGSGAAQSSPVRRTCKTVLVVR